MAPSDEPTQPHEPDEHGPYRIADDATPSSHAARRSDDAPSRARMEPRPDLSDSEDRDGRDRDEDDGGDGDDATDSLPPPISRAASPRPWLVIAGVCAALLLISWLAGAPQLSLPDSDGVIRELTFGQRLNGVARTVIFLPLATIAGVFGLGALAFVRQRPIGDIAALFAKTAAIVSLASLILLVPSDIRFLKQALYVVGLPAFAATLVVPVFRLHPRDAGLAMVCALLGMMLLVFGAWVVVWATSFGGS